MAESPDNQQSIIRCEGVSKVYRMGGEAIYALKDVNLEVRHGEYMSVMGPSGSGKSTLFNMIGALDRPTEGHVDIAGVRLSTLSSRKLSFFRNHHIGYVFQSFNLIPALTARRNVMLPMLFAGWSESDATDQADKVLTEVGLGHRLNHRPHELSGGQQQRVAIARALSMEPTILLADEPTGNLDLKTGEEIIHMMGELCRDHGVTIITATHDHKMLSESDRICWIKDGRVDRIDRREDLDIKVGSVE
jgi:putative ABC transport system ATP-binding protein